MGVIAVYEGWSRVQAQLERRLEVLTARELALSGSAEGWPVWMMIAHIASARVYWLCGVFQEPGADTTPFKDPFGEAWDDTPDVPRDAEELRFAAQSSWAVVQSCLERWSPDALAVTFSRERNGRTEHHSRASVLTRLVMHDAFHCGEASLVLGMHGLASMDPWELPPQPVI